MKLVYTKIFLLVLLVLSCKGENEKQAISQSVEVPVQELKLQSVSFNNSYPAIIKGENDVEIRPKVAGFITKVCIQEGQKVKKGQLLFTLDDTSFKAIVEQAKAAVLTAKAGVSTAKLNYDNGVNLQKQQIIGEANLETLANALAMAEANLAQAQAGLKAAKENLSYCHITSPIQGVVGTIPFRVGNLVSPSTPQALTQVADIHKMFVYFSMAESQILPLLKKEDAKTLIEKFPKVQLRLVDGSIYEVLGAIKTLSGVVDQSTGSVSVRADFTNPKGLLRSGGSGNILIPYTKNDAILVPQTATIEVLNQKYVYLVDEKNQVHYTPIEIASVDDGQNYIVTQGLKEGDRIVLAGLTMLKDGVQITPLTEQQMIQKREVMKKMGATSIAK